MIKVNIDKDELYPYYYILNQKFGYNIGHPAEVDREKLTHWQSVMDEFFKVQDEMRQHYERD